MDAFIKSIHLLAMAAWVGGMFFVLTCLRPAAAQTLAPPQRVPLVVATLRRFFLWVAGAIVLLWLTGGWRLAQVAAMEGARIPPAWHAMAGIAAVMTVLFGVIAHGVFPKARRAAAESDWPRAAAALERIRLLVAVNLVLGVATVVVATGLR